MRYLLFSSLISIVSLSFIHAQNQLPVILSLEVGIDPANKSYQVDYTFQDMDSDSFEVTLLFSTDKGDFFIEADDSATGDIGRVVDQSGAKLIEGTYTFDLPSNLDDMQVRLVISDYDIPNIQDIVDQVKSENLRAYLESIQGIRHPVGNLDHYRQSQSIIQEHLDTLSDRNDSYFFDQNGFQAQNIIANKLGGSNSYEFYLVGGHYDTIINSPGADDNGTAVAGMMEIARILSNYTLSKSVRYVAWDAEEEGLLGSSHYVGEQLVDYGGINGYLNFEMIGYASTQPNTQSFPTGFSVLFPEVFQEVANNDFRGDFLTNVGNGAASMEMALDFEEIGEQYVPDLNIITVLSPGTGIGVLDLLRSDHAPFWFVGLPALMLTDGAEFRNPNYHTPNDQIETIDFEFFTKCVKAGLAYLLEKAELEHATFQDFDDIQFLLSNDKIDISSSIKVFPNPSFEDIYLSAPSEIGHLQWNLLSIKGEVVAKGLFASNQLQKARIDVRHLNSGLYILRFKSIKGRGSKRITILD